MDMRQVNKLPKCSPPKGLATTAISWSRAPAWLETGHVCCKATKPVGEVMCFWCLGKWHYSCAAKCPEVWDEAQKAFYKGCSDLEWAQEIWQCPRCYFTLGKWQWFQKAAEVREEKAEKLAKPSQSSVVAERSAPRGWGWKESVCVPVFVSMCGSRNTVQLMFTQ